MLKLLIAVDGSAHAHHAIEAAGRLAAQVSGVQAVLLNVREPPVFYGDLPPYDVAAVEQAGRAFQQDLLDKALASAQACGLKQVEVQAEQGMAAPEIARVAAERSVDQIVMGTHGRSALSGLLLGSVAQRVVHLAAMPVLLVK